MHHVVKKKVILNFMAATHLKMVDQSHVHHCVASFLLLTAVHKCLGTEETGRLLDIRNRNVVPFLSDR